MLIVQENLSHISKRHISLEELAWGEGIFSIDLTNDTWPLDEINRSNRPYYIKCFSEMQSDIDDRWRAYMNFDPDAIELHRIQMTKAEEILLLDFLMKFNGIYYLSQRYV